MADTLLEQDLDSELADTSLEQDSDGELADTSLGQHLYGFYPGALAYDTESKSWLFPLGGPPQRFKQVQTRQGLHYSGTCSNPPSIHFTTPHISSNYTKLKDIATKLARRHPQLAPATFPSARLALASVALQNRTSRYDPRIGGLLSFGSITLGGLYNSARRLAAIATGETGNILQLAILSKERHRWGGWDRTSWVEGPSLKEADCGYWNEEAAPIQQICYAQSEDRNTLLAVRLPTRTVILRPIYYRHPRPARPSLFHHLPPSLIDAHPILSLGKDQTEKSAHIDVDFNPDFQYRLGIVSQNHTWSVWEIGKKHIANMYTISCMARGCINPSEDAGTNRQDGWARMLWIHDLYTFLVCDRRYLGIVSIKGDAPIHFSCPSMFEEESADWILDVKRYPNYKDHALVLTSKHLILVEVFSSSEYIGTSNNGTRVSVLVSCAYFRDPRDFTLQVTVQRLTEDESCVLLYSRLNSYIQAFTFKEQSSNPAKPIVLWSWPKKIDLQLDGVEDIFQLHLEPMQFGFQKHDKISRSDPPRSDKEMRFYRLFVTRSDLSVHETVFYMLEYGEMAASDSTYTVETFERSFIKHSRQRMSRKESIKDEQGFIVPNGMTVLAGTKSKTVFKKPEKARDREQALYNHPPKYGLLYHALTQKGSSYERAAESVDIETVSNQVNQMFINASGTKALPLGTLMECSGGKLRLSDIDEASSIFQQLLMAEHRLNLASIRQIASAHILNLTGDREPTITNLYDDILQHWVAPLPLSTPVRVRQNREQLARRISGEVMLASHRIRHIELQDPSIEQQYQSSQDSGTALPTLPLRPPTVGEMSSQEWDSSPLLPPPSQSSMPPSSQPSLRSVTPLDIRHFGDPIVRLSEHLQLKEHSLTPTIIPGSVIKLLGHWQLGSDPRAYDWRTSERTFRSESRDTQASREKEERRKARRDRRQQRENEIMRSRSLSQTPIEISTRSQSLSQPPSAHPMSSPGPTLTRMGSSSQGPSRAQSQAPIKLDNVPPMSQVEPGRFGGRLDKKKRKKGRVSGF